MTDLEKAIRHAKRWVARGGNHFSAVLQIADRFSLTIEAVEKAWSKGENLEVTWSKEALAEMDKA